MSAVFHPHEGILAVHVAAGTVALTAIALVAFDVSALWWLAPLAGLAYGLALIGQLAPCRQDRAWIRAYDPGPGRLLHRSRHALLVVSLDGIATIAAWLLPMLLGTPLIERRVARITQQTTTARRKA
jgi:hypothetical protein